MATLRNAMDVGWEALLGGSYSKQFIKLTLFPSICLTNGCADERVEPLAISGQLLHMLDVERASACIRVQIDSPIRELNPDGIWLDFICHNTGISAQVSIAFHVLLPYVNVVILFGTQLQLCQMAGSHLQQRGKIPQKGNLPDETTARDRRHPSYISSIYQGRTTCQ